MKNGEVWITSLLPVAFNLKLLLAEELPAVAAKLLYIQNKHFYTVRKYFLSSDLFKGLRPFFCRLRCKKIKKHKMWTPHFFRKME